MLTEKKRDDVECRKRKGEEKRVTAAVTIYSPRCVGQFVIIACKGNTNIYIYKVSLERYPWRPLPLLWGSKTLLSLLFYFSLYTYTYTLYTPSPSPDIILKLPETFKTRLPPRLRRLQRIFYYCLILHAVNVQIFITRILELLY